MSAGISLAGCGGDGTDSQQPTNRTVDVYLTGDPGKSYAHVWVTIEGVTLTNGLTSQSILDRAPGSGVKVDLATLKDKQGPLYWFLGSKTFPAGMFFNAQLTVSSDVTLVPKAKGAPALKAKFGDGKSPDTVWTVDLSKFQPTAPGTNIVLDVTSGWKVGANGLFPPKDKFLKLSDSGGVTDPARHVVQTFVGTVQSLEGVGADRNFTLAAATGPVDVTTSSTTKGVADAKPASQLTEGKRVRVTGRYDGVSETFKATAVAPDAGDWSHARL